MNVVPVRRRSVVSVVMGALAMAGSVAVIGVLVFSDVADAKAPRKAVPQQVQVAKVETEQTVKEANAPAEDPLVLTPEEELQVAPKKKGARKHKKVDFGRFEGY
jgi:hypothetical protein